MSSLFKKLVIALIITVVLGAVYYFTFGKSIDDTSTTNDYTVSGSEVSLRSQKILSDTQTIDNYKLDVSIFDDRRFKSLKDSGVTIPDVATGRNNPFAPVQ